jgi:hypothetical protein
MTPARPHRMPQRLTTAFYHGLQVATAGRQWEV